MTTYNLQDDIRIHQEETMQFYIHQLRKLRSDYNHQDKLIKNDFAREQMQEILKDIEFFEEKIFMFIETNICLL